MPLPYVGQSFHFAHNVIGGAGEIQNIFSSWQDVVSRRLTLLQAEVPVRVSGLANVLFCALAVHYIVFIFCF